ncbi:MAG: hypothetical protein E6K38_07340 [Gammaproteobacteria bacterium]|nr:MAG: hypothetical protein E6K38_07340 [Gammaproteobacteria bacterium]
MSGFPGNLEHETIGEAKRGPLPELLKRRCHNVGILKGQVLMIEQRVERGSDLLSSAAIDRIDVFGALKNLGEVTGLIQSSARRFLRSHWSAVPP